MKLLTQLFLTSLIILKLAIGSLFIYQMVPDCLILEGNAIASEPQKDSEGTTRPVPPLETTVPLSGIPAQAPAKQDEAASANQVAVDDEPFIEEEEIDLDFLRKRKAELEKREEGLEREKAALLAIQEDLNKKIAILTGLRNEIRAEMAREKTYKEQRLKHIIRAYSAMKPQKAASLIEKLDMDFAIELLSNMKGDIVGNILSFLEPQRAAKISEKLANQK